MMRTLLLGTAVAAAAAAQDDVFLVSGATGRTGSLIYSSLAAAQAPGTAPVRALVRDLDTARSVLNCTACDASEGIYLGDVTDPATLVAALAGVTRLAIAVGAPGDSTSDEQASIEWRGVQNQVAAMALQADRPLAELRVALISSMGTTDPDPQPYMGGADLFWKLQAEAFLGTCGVPSYIVKPCGLSDDPGSARTLLVGHDDDILDTRPPTVPRADVARTMVHALTAPQCVAAGLRLDLCSTKGEATEDLDALFQAGRWSWAERPRLHG